MIGQQAGRMPKGTALRRYPALGFLAVAALLAVALPSALTVPNAGPPTLAEFAPVPGQGTGAGGDIGRLGAGSSGGPGSGDIGAPGSPDLDPEQPPSSLKRCVGSPPRQTEDPLSPPCVAFFDGDNGGKTWRGVTRDEVTAVVYLRTLQGSPPAGTIVDYDEPPEEDDYVADYSLKVYARYFNERYQTYGRRVHLYGFYTIPFTEGTVIERRRADAHTIDTKLRPFAVLPLDANPITPFVDEASSLGMLSIAYDGFARTAYRRHAPLMWSYFPDLEDQADMTAGYVCTRLAGRPARYSGNVEDQDKRRVFGIVYTQSPREPEYPILKDLITRRLREQCNVRIAAEASASERIEEGQGQAATGLAALRSAGVTTVIVPALANTVLAYAGAASGSAWFPEWVLPGRRGGVSGMDRGQVAKLMPQEHWRRAFGITFMPRWGSDAEQHWSAAYVETCGGCRIRSPYRTSSFYDTLRMLFHGIQAAGPRLTPANFDKGMHAIPARASRDVFTPAAYFSPGNYSYVKDAMEIWWDPSGPAPGGDASPGCYRLPDEGRRFRAREWRGDDADLFRRGSCNGDAPSA